MSAPVGRSRPLHAAVIGVGAFGRHHARIYSELSGERVELVGLVDHGGEIAEEVATRLGVPLVARFEDLPVRPDLVSVAVDTTRHRAVAEPLLRSGIHCLIEKPIADRVEDGEALLAAAEAGGACLQVGHVERFNPALAAVAAFPGTPRWIEAHRLAPYRARNRDVGVVMDLMIHDLEILQHIVGAQAGTVAARARTDHDGAEDVCVARLGWGPACGARVVASRVASERRRVLRLFGEDAWLHIDLDAGTAVRGRPKDTGRWAAALATRLAAGPDLEPETLAGALGPLEQAVDAQPLSVEPVEPLRAELEAFVAAVAGGTSPDVSGAQGLAALRTAEEILRQVASGAAGSPA